MPDTDRETYIVTFRINQSRGGLNEKCCGRANQISQSFFLDVNKSLAVPLNQHALGTKQGVGLSHFRRPTDQGKTGQSEEY